MPTFKRQSKATAELHVLPHSGSLPHDQRDVWLSNEDICGRAVFKLPPNVNFTHSQVQLKGRKILLSSQVGCNAELLQVLSLLELSKALIRCRDLFEQKSFQ